MTNHADLITWYDDATGERVGLAASEVGDWAAATAAMLTAGCGLGPGSRAAVLLPPHWQTAAVLLGCWSAGLEVSFRGWSTAGLEPAGDPLDATFVEQRRIGNWLDNVPTGRHQFVLFPAGEIPAGYRNWITEAESHLGAPPPAPAAGPDDPATPDGTTFGEYGAAATALAQANGIGPGDRLLIDVSAQENPLSWLLAPLSAGASLVLCANLDSSRLAERVAAEGVTRTVLA